MVVAEEIEVEQEHFVKPNGRVNTHTDVYIPSHVDEVSKEMYETLWEVFDIDLDDPQYNVNVVDN